MFHKLITKYGLATHLALLASLPYALMPFLSEKALGITILWLSAFAGLWLLVEPSILSGEHLSSARTRVRKDIVRNPIFWFFLVAAAFAAIRWLNSGIELCYDSEQGWSVAQSVVDILPASAGDSGFLPFAVVVGAGVLSVGILHGLGLSARISFGLSTGFLLGIAGLVWGILVCLESEPFVHFAMQGFFPRTPVTPLPFYGTSYGLALALSIIVGMQAEGRKWSSSRLFFCVAVAGNLAGLLFFSPPLLTIAYLVVIGLFLLFSVVHLSRVGSLGGVAYSLTMVLFGAAFAVCLLLAMAPEAVAKAKSDGLDLATVFPETYRQVAAILERISRSMWQQSPWRGAGIGTFSLQARFLAEKADWMLLAPNVSSALSGYWTVLAERGILGCIMLASMGCLFVFMWIKNLIRSIIYLRTRDDADVFLFACTPMVWVAPVVIPLFCAEAFYSPVFSCSATLFALVAILALSAASFPREPKPRVAAAD